MARAVLECELIPASIGRLRFALAAEADDAEIRRLFRENPMAGRISLSFEHEPNWFSDARLPEQTKQTIVAREAGRVVCVGFCSIRRRFVNGAPRRVGYLGGLRLCSRQAGRFDILRRGYESSALSNPTTRRISILRALPPTTMLRDGSWNAVCLECRPTNSSENS